MTKRRLNSVWQKHISSQISFSSESFQGSFFPICEMHTRAQIKCVTEQCETDKLSLGIVRFTLKEQSVLQKDKLLRYFSICYEWLHNVQVEQSVYIWNIVKCRPLTKHVTNRQTVVGISFNAALTDWGRDLRAGLPAPPLIIEVVVVYNISVQCDVMYCIRMYKCITMQCDVMCCIRM